MHPHTHGRRLRPVLFAVGFTALGAALTLAGGAIASPVGHRGPPGAQVVRMLEELDLRPEQQKQVDTLKAEAKEAMREHHAERKADAEAWIGLMRQDKLTRAHMHQQVDDKLNTMRDELHELADQLFDIYASLDTSQRAALVEAIEQQLARAPGPHRGPRAD